MTALTCLCVVKASQQKAMTRLCGALIRKELREDITPSSDIRRH